MTTPGPADGGSGIVVLNLRLGSELTFWGRNSSVGYGRLDLEGAMTQTVASLAVETLIANGIDNLYCLPGVQNDPFFNALYDRRDALAPIQSRHEQGAAYMALGAALATGEPQAFCVVPGPGLLNTAAALSTAYATNAPVLALVTRCPLRGSARVSALSTSCPIS